MWYDFEINVILHDLIYSNDSYQAWVLANICFGKTCTSHFLFQVIEELLDLGTEVDILDEQERTPLHFAVVVNRMSVLKFLIKKGKCLKKMVKGIIPISSLFSWFPCFEFFLKVINLRECHILGAIWNICVLALKLEIWLHMNDGFHYYEFWIGGNFSKTDTWVSVRYMNSQNKKMVKYSSCQLCLYKFLGNICLY